MSKKVQSPCISICQIDPVSGNCLGCYRSRKEIGQWQELTRREQVALLEELKVRREQETGLKRRRSRGHSFS